MARKNVCLSITDLGDVEGFDDNPSPNKVYGFEYKYGNYKRKEIELGGVEGFNGEGSENKIYGLKFKDNKYVREEIKFPASSSIAGNWFAMPQKLSWALDISLETLNISGSISSISNKGNLMGRFNVTGGEIGVMHHKTILATKSSGTLQLATDDTLQDGPMMRPKTGNYSFCIEVFLAESPDIRLGSRLSLPGMHRFRFKELLPGVRIAWTKRASYRFCTIYKSSDGISSNFTDGVEFQLEDEIRVDGIFLYDNLALHRYRFIDREMPLNYLKAACDISEIII